MNRKMRMVASICWIVIGAALMGAYYAGMADDYWNGMGTVLFVVGVLQMIRHIRYRTDEAYQARVDVEAKDERNRFISGRAWAWAGYTYVMIAAAASVFFRLSGDDLMTQMAARSACLVMLLYAGCSFILRRKY